MCNQQELKEEIILHSWHFFVAIQQKKIMFLDSIKMENPIGLWLI